MLFITLVCSASFRYGPFMPMNGHNRARTLILEYVNWSEFEHAEQVYDLKHLRPYTTSYERPAKDKRPAEKFSVNVTFSHHCFTRGLPRDGSAYDLTQRFDYEGDYRIFDVDRWELSKLLPGIIAKLPANKCQQSGHGNYFTIEMIAGDGRKIEYEVFFRVWKPGKGRIYLHVDTAYIREEDYGSSRPKGMTIDFYVILYRLLRHPLQHPQQPPYSCLNAKNPKTGLLGNSARDLRYPPTLEEAIAGGISATACAAPLIR
jgi:hypothetical protein